MASTVHIGLIDNELRLHWSTKINQSDVREASEKKKNMSSFDDRISVGQSWSTSLASSWFLEFNHTCSPGLPFKMDMNWSKSNFRLKPNHHIYIIHHIYLYIYIYIYIYHISILHHIYIIYCLVISQVPHDLTTFRQALGPKRSLPSWAVALKNLVFHRKRWGQNVGFMWV